MRLAAYITTFDRPGTLRKTLLQYLTQTRPPEHLLVVDNGRDPATEQVVRSFDPGRVAYHRMESNVGPAGAGAYALRRLAHQGYDWIVCGDDDDPPVTRDTLARLMEVARSAGPSVGVVGVMGTLWDWNRGRRVPLPVMPASGIVDVDVVGGSKLPTVSRSVVETVGVHDPELFFGEEDIEYCLRIRKSGFRIAVDAALFQHHLRLLAEGALKPKRLPPGTARPKHEIWRQYNNTRNHIHFMLRRYDRPRLAHLESIRALGRVARSWLYGPAYGIAYSSLQLRGIVDGYRGRMGITVRPEPKSVGSPSVPATPTGRTVT